MAAINAREFNETDMEMTNGGLIRVEHWRMNGHNY